MNFDTFRFLLGKIFFQRISFFTGRVPSCLLTEIYSVQKVKLSAELLINTQQTRIVALLVVAQRQYSRYFFFTKCAVSSSLASNLITKSVHSKYN